MAAGMLLLALPASLRLRKSLRNLERVRDTYAKKLDWAGQVGALQERVREQEARMAELDDQLLTEDRVPEFTQALASAARAARCRVASIHPLEPRIIPRPELKEKKASAKQEQNAPRSEFVRSAVRMSLVGEYGQLCVLLSRLASLKWHASLARLALQPDGEDRVSVTCSLEVAGYRLKMPPQE
jgi:Tfp pilus assembly protein PilO